MMKIPHNLATGIGISGIFNFIAFLFYCNEEWFSTKELSSDIACIFVLIGFGILLSCIRKWSELKGKNNIPNSAIFTALYIFSVYLGVIISLVACLGVFTSVPTTGIEEGVLFFSCLLYFLLAFDVMHALPLEEIKNKEKVAEDGVHVMD